MKLKNKISAISTIGLASLLLFMQLFAPILQSRVAAAGQGPPTGANIVKSQSDYYCKATIQSGQDASQYTIVSGANSQLRQDTVDNWAGNGSTPSADKSDLKSTGKSDIVDGKKTIVVTFTGESSAWTTECNNALFFVQSQKTPSKFYGFYNSKNFKDTISQGLGLRYSNLEATASVSGSTYQLSFSLNGHSFKINLSGNVSTVLSGIGGGGSASTGIDCLATSSDKDCLKILGTPTFTDADTLVWAKGNDKEIYKAATWGGTKEGDSEYMEYTLASSTSAVRQASVGSSKAPFFGLSVDGNGTNSLDINMDDKAKGSDIKNLYTAFSDISSGKKTLNLQFYNRDKEGNSLGNTAVSANITGLQTVATYYPGNTGDTPTVQLIWPLGGTNEQIYVGNYVQTSATTYQMKATDGNITSCNSTNPPAFTFASSPDAASKAGTTMLSATWKLPSSDCTYNGSGAPIKVAIAKQGTAIPDLASANTTSDIGSSPEINCSVSLFNPLSWFLCPLATALETVVAGLDNEINNYLDVKAGKSSYSASQLVNCGSDQWCGYYTAWSVVRTISLGLIAIFALVAVVSQAMGIEIFDAYTIRKVLPRLLIAAIGITLSWPLMMWFINFTNDLGLGVRQLIYAPFKANNYKVQLGGGGQAISSFFAAGAIVALGFAGLLSFVATAALAAAVAFLVLTLRQMLIVMLVIFAPIAIACYVLPNTQKVWKLWSDSYMKGLMMFPIIAGFIAIGRVFAAVNSTGAGSINQIISFTAYFAPYFLIPFTFRLAGGAVSTIAGVANDRSKGMFDRLSKGRQTRMADRFQRAQNQSLWDNNSKIGKLANKGASWATDPLSNAAYHGRNLPGLSKRGNKVAFGLEHSQIEQSKKLLDEINPTFNDKAYRAINGGLHQGLSAATQQKFKDAGIYGKSPQSLSDFQQMAHILQNSDEQTERIAGNAIEGASGRLATLYQDPEMGKANIAAAGMMGLAAHGFLNGNDINPATEQLRAAGGSAFAQAIGGQSQLLVAKSMPHLKAGYGMDVQNGQMVNGLNTNGGLRGFELLTTLNSGDIAGAKGGFFKANDEGGFGTTLEDVLRMGGSGSATENAEGDAARQELVSKFKNDDGSRKVSEADEKAERTRMKTTAEGQRLLKYEMAAKHHDSVKKALVQNAGQYSHASVDVQTSSAAILGKFGIDPNTGNVPEAVRAENAPQPPEPPPGAPPSGGPTGYTPNSGT